ncbi:MAG: molybdenum ABC transporter permease [Candidatus Bathyarchaeum sp.]|nr:MAG: molybdenum ABC transporter permease [Candidatus Bathyarchaeum sp.]
MPDRKLLSSIKNQRLSLVFLFVGSLLILFTILTLFNMIFRQLVLDTGGLLEAATDPVVIESIVLTLYCSFLATLIAAILGTPLAYVLARHNFRGKTVVESIIDVPIIIPHSVAGIALYALFMSRSPVGSAFSSIGVVFEDSMWGIVVAMLFVSAPFYVNAAKEGFQSINPRLERVARTLGASQWKSFYKITLPLAIRHLFSGAIMAWARGISEFGAVIMIAFYPMIAPILIYYRFTTHGLAGSQPIAVLLILICIGVFVILRTTARYWETKK